MRRLPTIATLVGRVEDLPGWNGERLAAGEYRLTTEAPGCLQPELRVPGLPDGSTVRASQSFRGGVWVFALVVRDARGNALELEPGALELWGLQMPAAPATEENV